MMKPFGLVLVFLTVLFPAYQIFSLPNISDQTALFSQYLGLVALILMAWGQVLSTRLTGIEHLFGGIDRVYVVHKWAGITAMGAILLHDTIGAEMRGLGRETALNDFAESLGEVSLYGLLALALLSVATFIPYHLWKWTHKAMGAMFVLGAFHFFLITKPFTMTDPAGLYTGFFCVAGIAAYVWMLLPARLRPSYKYKVSDLETSGGALAVTLRPANKACHPKPGQFGVLSFVGSGKTEPHPFSFSKINPDGSLRVTIKPLGDYTATLSRALKTDQSVRIQGPYGRFRYIGRGREVWIAGGIGITPFLAWAHALGEECDPVDLFYCVTSREEAPHLAEIQALADARSNLTLHLMASKEGQRLSAERIAEFIGPDLSNVRFSFCGPESMRQMLRLGLRGYGVASRRFQYEEFEFRSGIGLKRFAIWLLARPSVSRDRWLSRLSRPLR